MAKRISVALFVLSFALFVLAGIALAADRIPGKISAGHTDPTIADAGFGPSASLPYGGAKLLTANCGDETAPVTIIQLDQWASTYYDYQKNGSMGRMIAVDTLGYRHFICHETRGPYGEAYPRYITYNCKNPSNAWTFGTTGSQIEGGDGINAGYANIDLMHNGREAVIYHRTAGTHIWNTSLTLGYGTGYICSGTFTSHLFDIPDSMAGAVEPAMWPKIATVWGGAANDTDYFHIVMTEGKTSGGNQHLGYTRCHLIHGDTLLCESPNNGLQGVGTPTKCVNQEYTVFAKNVVASFGEVAGMPGQYPNTISVIAVASPKAGSKKIAVVFTNKKQTGDIQVDNDVFYFEDNNNGKVWFDSAVGKWPPTTTGSGSFQLYNVTNYPAGNGWRAYTDVAACYDSSDKLHIAWNVGWLDTAGGGSTYATLSQLYHWSLATGITQIADANWYGTSPGGWNRNISKMSISAGKGNYLYCTWTQFNEGDTSSEGYGNGEIYGSVSANNGGLWTPGYNLTNTTGLSEHWSSLAENLYTHIGATATRKLHMEYVCDKDAGGMVQEEGTWTDNPMMYEETDTLPYIEACGVGITLTNPSSYTNPPVKVPTAGASVTLQLKGLYNVGGNYQVKCTDSHMNFEENGSLNPGATKNVTIPITYGTPNFVNAKIIIRGCTDRPADSTHVEKMLFAVCSDTGYYECNRDPKTMITTYSAGLFKLWACVNGAQELADRRLVATTGESDTVIFRASVIAATSWQGDTIVGRQGYKDNETNTSGAGLNDTIRVYYGKDQWFNKNCAIKRINSQNTYVWKEPAFGQDPRWYWIDIWEDIIMYDSVTCPTWIKENVIKYVWLKKSPIPAWWPTPQTDAYDDIYYGYYADLDAPYDTSCDRDGAQSGCNTAGKDDTKKIYYQVSTDPLYPNYHVGLALTDTAGTIVTPLGAHNVLNENYLYPNNGWGWDDKQLYHLAATAGVSIDSGDGAVEADRGWVLTAGKINAGAKAPDFNKDFILIETATNSGLSGLQVDVDSARSIVKNQLNNLKLGKMFSRAVPVCGDLNASGGAANVADLTYLVDFLFRGGPPPYWPAARADMNASCGAANVADLTYLVDFLFRGGPKPKCKWWICP